MESLLAPMHRLLKNYRLILASGSPRRKMLLTELGLKFETVTREYSESFPVGLEGKEIAEYISNQKAGSFRGQLSANEIVITADTIVWSNGKVLGKPDNYDQAVKMLAE
jgi:septum formation protein